MAIRYTHKEELWNSWSHAGGIVMGAVFGVIFLWMSFRGDNPWARLGGLPVSLWHAQLVHRLHRLPCLTPTLQMARALSPLGSCSHLLAHRRLVFTADARSPAHPRLLGLVSVCFCVALCSRRYHYQLYPIERSTPTLRHSVSSAWD